ncbi:MAG TPA: hypothetical protein VHO84_10120 [Syntrophorhabdaceae bacterium]|nr:hypothetical protein [Syntrophorhabdaceae bacterium]
MTRKWLMLGFVLMMVISFSFSANAWTGRMAGMGNPYGLVEDESDFLFHPALITQGKGIALYGDLGFSYNKLKWSGSSTFAEFLSEGGDVGSNAIDVKGHEWVANTRLGITFPAYSGRMGVFLGYSGNTLSKGKYTGSNSTDFDYTYTNDLPQSHKYTNETASFPEFRFIYAQPLNGKLKLGGEFGITYREEKLESSFSAGDDTISNFSPFMNHSGQVYMVPFQVPYNSKYWDATLKGSVETQIGPSTLSFTPYYGTIIDGRNRFDYNASLYDSYNDNIMAKGSIHGWRVGGELWWRFPVSSNSTVPVLLRVERGSKKRTGTSNGSLDGYDVSAIDTYVFSSRERNLTIEFGPGINALIGNGNRVAAGIYYGFSKKKTDFDAVEWDEGEDLCDSTNYNGIPDSKEHRVTLKGSGEFAISPVFSLTSGLNLFYSKVKNNYSFYFENDLRQAAWNMKGHAWGIGASIGAIYKLNQLSVEPYINGGYQRLRMSGNGWNTNDSDDYGSGTITARQKKSLWNVGTGFAIKFN